MSPCIQCWRADSTGWPSQEQQLCGRGSDFLFFASSALEGGIPEEWVTPKQDIDYCMMWDEPGKYTSQPKGRLDRLCRRGRTTTTMSGFDQPMSRFAPLTSLHRVFPSGFLVGELAPPRVGWRHDSHIQNCRWKRWPCRGGCAVYLGMGEPVPEEPADMQQLSALLL